MNAQRNKPAVSMAEIKPELERLRRRGFLRNVLSLGALTMLTGCDLSTHSGFRGHRFVGKEGQWPATPFATQAAFARSGTPGFLRLVRLLTLRRRQAGIVRGFRRFVELCFKLRNPCRQVLHLRPQRVDQGVFLGVAQVVKVRKPEHAPG